MVPQHCKWVELLPCVGLEMVVWVIKWEWTFEMDSFGVGVVVTVEVDVRDSMEDIEENIEAIVELSHKVLSNLVSKIDFRVDMTKVSKERVCSNYFEMDVHNLEIVN